MDFRLGRERGFHLKHLAANPNGGGRRNSRGAAPPVPTPALRMGGHSFRKQARLSWPSLSKRGCPFPSAGGLPQARLRTGSAPRPRDPHVNVRLLSSSTEKWFFRTFGEERGPTSVTVASAKLVAPVCGEDKRWVSWVAEVIFRFAHEPVAVAMPR